MLRASLTEDMLRGPTKHMLKDLPKENITRENITRVFLTEHMSREPCGHIFKMPTRVLSMCNLITPKSSATINLRDYTVQEIPI